MAPRKCPLILDISPCPWFDDQADNAAPAFTVAFTLMGRKYWGLNGGPHFKLMPATSITVYCDSQTEIDCL